MRLTFDHQRHNELGDAIWVGGYAAVGSMIFPTGVGDGHGTVTTNFGVDCREEENSRKAGEQVVSVRVVLQLHFFYFKKRYQ